MPRLFLFIAVTTFVAAGCNCGAPVSVPDAGGGGGGGFVPGGGGGGGGGVGGGQGGDAGRVAWVYRFSGGGFRGIAVDADGGILAMGGVNEFESANFGGAVLRPDGGEDITLARFAQTDGRHLWSKVIGGPDFDASETILALPEGGFILTGSFKATVVFGPGAGQTLTSAGQSDLFIASFETDGTLRWVKQFGSTDFELAQPVSSSLDADGNVLVIAILQDNSTYDGTVLNPTRDSVLLRIDPASGALVSFLPLGCNSPSTYVVAGATAQTAWVHCGFSQTTARLEELDVSDGGALRSVSLTTAGGTNRLVFNQLLRTDAGLRLTFASNGPIRIGGVFVDGGADAVDFNSYAAAVDEADGGVLWARKVSDGLGFGRSGIALGNDGTVWSAYDDSFGIAVRWMNDGDGGTRELTRSTQTDRHLNIVQDMAADGRGSVFAGGAVWSADWTFGGKTMKSFAPDGGDDMNSFLMKLSP